MASRPIVNRKRADTGRGPERRAAPDVIRGGGLAADIEKLRPKQRFDRSHQPAGGFGELHRQPVEQFYGPDCSSQYGRIWAVRACQALFDILAAKKSMPAIDWRMGVSENRYCTEKVRDALVMMQSNIQNLMYLIMIDLRMRDESDELNVKEIMKLATDAAITEFGTIRGWVNQLSGYCSKYPLPIAKTQQTLQLLGRATSFVKAISGRL